MDEPLFRYGPMRAEAALRAYSLVQMHEPEARLHDWNDFVASYQHVTPTTGGLVALEDTRGYVHAFFSYNVNYHLQHRQCLVITNLVVGMLPGRHLTRTIIEAIERIATDTDSHCTMIELAQRPAASRSRTVLHDPLVQAGFAPWEVSFLRVERES